MATPVVDRASPNDLMQLGSGHGPAPIHVAAVLLLAPAEPLDLTRVRSALADRARRVPRLRRRLVSTPLGCGRPIWVDDPAFDITRHVKCQPWPKPGGEQAVLDLATDLLVHPLPTDRPLWSVTLVTDPDGGRAALILVMSHVLADGIGGLGILDHLLDEGPPTDDQGETFPARWPSRRQLFLQASRARLAAIGPRTLARRVQEIAREARSARVLRGTLCSLNRPSGPRRRMAVVRARIDDVRTAAHANGGTVNDVVLAMVCGALGRLLRQRGEAVDRIVVSVPVADRRVTPGAAGNHVGAMLVRLPTTGLLRQRVREIAAITAKRKALQPPSSSMLTFSIRVMGALGVLQHAMDHQRSVNTFVTDLPGPVRRRTFLAAPVTHMIAVPTVEGNVTTAFAALSYAGTLTITALVDPDACPDLPALALHLQEAVTALPRIPGASAGFARGGVA